MSINSNALILYKNETKYKVANCSYMYNTIESEFEFAPFLSCYYFPTKIQVNTDLTISFYVTDYIQFEYIYDYAKNFLIEIIKDDGTTISTTVSAGDNILNIGKFTEAGEHYFTIQATDLDIGIKSYKQVINLLIIDDSYIITEEQTYYMTAEDLTTYSIDNTNNEDEATRIANSLNINELMKDKRDAGYKKFIFYNATGNDVYRIDPQGSRDNCVRVPAGLSIDGNGVKIKQHVYYDPNGIGGSLVFGMENDALNTNVENIKIEGDYDVHDLSPRYDDEGNQINKGWEAEGFGGIEFGGMFCTMKNVEMSYITSYAFGGTNTSYHSTCAQTFHSGAINLETGLDEANSNICSTEFTDITTMTGLGWLNPKNAFDYKFLTANIGGGYLGYTGNEIVLMFYYDENKNYLGYTKGKQFALIERPSNTKYVRVSVYVSDPSTISNGGGWGFRIFARDYMNNTSIEIDGLYAHNTRSCAIAYGSYNRLYIHNCIFDRVAEEEKYYLTKVIMDMEDGYQYQSNLFIENNEVINDTSYGGVNLVTGYNVVFKDNIKLGLRAHRVKGVYIEGNCYNLYAPVDVGYTTNMFRTKDVIFENAVVFGGISNKYRKIIKNSILKDGNNYANCSQKYVYYDGCTINTVSNGHRISGYFKNCEIIMDTSQYIGNSVFYNCNISGATIQPHTNDSYFYNCTISCAFNYGYKGNTYFIGCTLKNDYFNNPDTTYCHIDDDCIIEV